MDPSQKVVGDLAADFGFAKAFVIDLAVTNGSEKGTAGDGSDNIVSTNGASWVGSGDITGFAIVAIFWSASRAFFSGIVLNWEPAAFLSLSLGIGLNLGTPDFFAAILLDTDFRFARDFVTDFAAVDGNENTD